MSQPSTQERFKRGAADAGRYFQFMSEFIGFSQEHGATIRETRFIVEKYIPSIIAEFYAHLLRYPATRRHFQRPDGTIDQEYLELRMSHQANFWRRAASGEYDEDFARFVDYVGRAHTSGGADPKVYIPARYVMGMAGFVQQRLGEALEAELHELDPDLEIRAVRAWNAFIMVLLEMLARPYKMEREEESYQKSESIDDEAVRLLALETYERDLGIARSVEYREVHVGRAGSIPEGERRLIQFEDLSIGVFHHQGKWYALHNSCLHRGGPVAAGTLEGDTLTCPWHGYQYDVTNGQLLLDRTASLPMYPVHIRDGEVYLRVPFLVRDAVDVSLEQLIPASEPIERLAENEFRLDSLRPGQAKRIAVGGVAVAVFNVDEEYYAIEDACSHVGGPLSEGILDGLMVVCPWHASCFDVTSGQVLCGPATEPVRTYRVVLAGEIGRVEQS